MIPLIGHLLDGGYRAWSFLRLLDYLSVRAIGAAMFAFILVLVVMFLASAIKILSEYERAVIFRLGRIRDAKGPGLIIIIPGFGAFFIPVPRKKLV